MNRFTLLVLAILAYFTYRGYRNGFAKSVVSTGSLILTIALVSWTTPYVTGFLEKNTGIQDSIMEQCEKSFSIHMDESKALSKSDGTVSQIHDAMIDQLKIPEIIKKGLKKNNKMEYYKALHVKNFNEYVPKYIADLILKALVFIVSWFLAAFLLYFFVKGLKLVTELPGVKGLNRILGIAFGLFQGLVIVWFMFLIITMLGGFSIGSSLLGMISESKFLGFLYDMNLVLRLLQSATHGIL